jgi:cellulose biosynthesis protein BcsQ
VLSKWIGTGEVRVLAVASNKGGVGKTTVATNLAIYLRALDEDLPILIFSTDDQGIVDRMFGVPGARSGRDLATGWSMGRFDDVIQTGQYGVDWIPSATSLAALSAQADATGSLRECIEKSARCGLVIVDTKSDLGRLTTNALEAADCVIAPVSDHASLLEVAKVLAQSPHPRRLRVLQTLVDRRTRISPSGPLLARALRDEIARRGWPRFDVEISRSPRLELLNSESDRPRSVLHDARGTAVHREFRALAGEVMRALAPAEAPSFAPARRAPAAARNQDDRKALLTWFRSRWDAS